MLNTRWWSVFQSREEAEWIYPHVIRPRSDLSETERHREFVRSVQNLRRQHFYLYVKGHNALRLRAPDVREPSAGSTDELRAIFRRQIASRSMVAARTAADLIAKWEAQVVDATPPEVPNLTSTKKRPTSRGVDQLLRDLGLGK